jgi:hypothetical protein
MRVTDEQASLDVVKILNDLLKRWMNLDEEAISFLQGWQEHEDWKAFEDILAEEMAKENESGKYSELLS